MNASKLKKQIVELNNERNTLVHFTLNPKQMIKGKLYQSARVCGNPNCKCAKGEKHISWYLIVNRDGRSRQDYVGASVPENIKKQVDQYQSFKNAVKRIRHIDKEISQLLNSLRDTVSVSMKAIKSKNNAPNVPAK